MEHKVVVPLERNKYYIELMLPEYYWSPTWFKVCAVSLQGNSGQMPEL